MGAPNTTIGTSDTSVAAGDDQSAQPSAVDADTLAGIDEVLAVLKQKDESSAESAAKVLQGREDFLDEFRRTCETEVRPAMQAVADRLRRQGGDGLIEEHPGGEPRVATPRLTLWMSLQGAIDGAPRQDRHPYLQLDADGTDRVIRLTEGDSWNGAGGGHSGSAGTWKPADVTSELVASELVEIIRRSAGISAT